MDSVVQVNERPIITWSSVAEKMFTPEERVAAKRRAELEASVYNQPKGRRRNMNKAVHMAIVSDARRNWS